MYVLFIYVACPHSHPWGTRYACACVVIAFSILYIYFIKGVDATYRSIITNNNVIYIIYIHPLPSRQFRYLYLLLLYSHYNNLFFTPSLLSPPVALLHLSHYYYVYVVLIRVVAVY